jgi:hypothetical protein
MFGDWNDEDWCEFDNYMVNCLVNYLNTGLVKSKFVNLNIRQLSAETCHDFIEWCGLIDKEDNKMLEPDKRLYLSDLYYDFTDNYPDYGPRSKMTVSRQKFSKWLQSYALFKENTQPEMNRDMRGKWIIIKSKKNNPEFNDGF